MLSLGLGLLTYLYLQRKFFREALVWNRTGGVRIYKRKQESIKERKHVSTKKATIKRKKNNNGKD